MHCCRPCKSTRALLDVVVAWPARVKEDASSVMPAEHSPGQRAFDIEHVPLLFSVDEATAREDGSRQQSNTTLCILLFGERQELLNVFLGCVAHAD